MLPEMRYIEDELLPMLRERAQKHENSAQKQLRQWKGEAGVCSLLLHVTDLPEMQKLPAYNNEEIHYDVEKMFISQLKAALGAALAEGDAVPSVRANAGCGMLCTLIGGLKQNFFPDKMPWILKHMPLEEAAQLTRENIVESPEFKAAMEQMRYMKAVLEGTGIGVFPVDLQGPIDMAHLICGDEFFYDLYDEPEMVHKLMELTVELCAYGMEKCFEIIQPTDYVCHYNDLVLPAATPLKISEDTSTLLCEEHLKEFMQPYTEKLLARFGGGYIHYCGDNRHLLNMVPGIKGGIGMNFGNPERHDPKAVLSALAQQGRCYYGRFPQLTLGEQVALSRQPDGRYNLFVTAHCKAEEQLRVMDEFQQALEAN